MPSSRARIRHKQVGHKFFKWLAKNPNATLKEKVVKFNQIADLAYEEDRKKMEDEIKAA